ncbi:AI-2E family transporter [Portibacter lacus]|uniref:AI-2E family transporter n=1 Tax=Portibacter lacus TaxID=1099794 RepID=A0AA37SUD7_9BACT|nr:AI-2E family transporter [Portibacter lacus]GLR18966.1 AI-2E family transporter [Portibacter lacus]
MSKDITESNYKKFFIPFLLIVTTILFLTIIWDYILAVFLAAIISGLLYPFYKWVLRKLKGRSSLASIIVLSLVLLVIIIPSIFMISLIVNEAIYVSEEFGPLVQEQLKNSASPDHRLPNWLPFSNELEPYKVQLFEKVSELAGRAGNILVSNLTALTQGTFVFFLNLFILLYALYYFLIKGEKLVEQTFDYVPLNQDDFQQLINQGLSVTRATLKGALFIGLLQGTLVGLAFWVIGIRGAAFWGAIAAAMSVIPSIGSGIVWVPAVIYLFITGEVVSAIGLTIWGAAIVGTIDNLLRPHLVGKDTQMPDLLILLSTLGGLSFFGVTGFVLGPIIAGLLMTIWGIFRKSLSNI